MFCANLDLLKLLDWTESMENPVWLTFTQTKAKY